MSATAISSALPRERPRRQVHPPARRGEFQRIVEQVARRLGQQVAVAHQVEPRGQVGLQNLSTAFGDSRVEFRGILQHRHEVDRREGGTARACLGLGDAQQRAEHAGDVVEVGDALLHGGAQVGGVAIMVQRLLQLGARAGDRRAQVVRDGIRDTPQGLHQPVDALEHGVHAFAQPVELVVAPRQRHAAGEVAGGDGVGGLRGGAQAGFERATQQRGAGQREDGGGGSRPGDALGQQVAQAILVLHVAPDREAVALPEFEREDACLDLHAVALHGAVRPGLLIGMGKRPAIEVARDTPAGGVHQQVDRVALHIGDETLGDRLAHRGGAGLAPALDQTERIGPQGGIGLAVERTGGRVPEHQREDRRGGHEHAGEQQREAEAGTAQEAQQRVPADRHVARRDRGGGHGVVPSGAGRRHPPAWLARAEGGSGGGGRADAVALCAPGPRRRPGPLGWGLRRRRAPAWLGCLPSGAGRRSVASGQRIPPRAPQASARIM